MTENIISLIKQRMVTNVNNVGNVIYFYVEGSSAPYIIECQNTINAEYLVNRISEIICA